MRIASIAQPSIVDGIGLRLPIFFQGCKHNCKGCHNLSTHDINKGYEIDTISLVNIIRMHLDNNPLIQGVTYSGGEPLLQVYQLNLLTKLIKLSNPEVNFTLYTGFKIKDVIELFDKIVSKIDYIIDGRYIEELRNIGLKFRGSSNQRIYQNINGQFVDITDII